MFAHAPHARETGFDSYEFVTLIIVAIILYFLVYFQQTIAFWIYGATVYNLQVMYRVIDDVHRVLVVHV